MLADQVEVPYEIAKWLRPHQRVGVQFAFDCISGVRERDSEMFKGRGCILADDVTLSPLIHICT